MSGWNDSSDCPACEGKNSLMTSGDNKPFDIVIGVCLECGFGYSTTTEDWQIREVNEMRKDYGLKPLTKLKKRLHEY